MKPYRSVICIYYPHQLLPALVALMHHRRLMLEVIEQPTLVYVRILIDNEQGKHIAQAIRNILSSVRWVTVEMTYPKTLGFIREYDVPVKWRARLLRRCYRDSSFQEIFYAHDLTADFLPQTFMQAFPNAERICFGDSLGIVYTHHYYTQLRWSADQSHLSKHRLSVTISSWLSWIQKIRRKYLLPKTILGANRAILMLPCDPGGDFLEGIELNIPRKKDILPVLDLLALNTRCLDLATEELLNCSRQKIVFFALSNLSESKLASLENELMLYQEIIDKQVPKEALLLVKPHPGSHENTLIQLKAFLKHKGGIHYISQACSVYPVELNQTMLSIAYKILSISYTSVSIPYLYDKKVEHVLDDVLIEKYFQDGAKKWVRQGNEEYLEMIEQLSRWDGKRPLVV